MDEKVKLALIVFAKRKEKDKPLMAWPLYSYDPATDASRLKEECNEWVKTLGIDAEFVIKEWITSEEVYNEIKDDLLKVDGLLVYILTTSLNYPLMFKVIKELQKPTVIFTEPYHSLAWPELASLQKEGLPLVSASSSSKEDLYSVLKTLYAYIKLKKSKSIVISTPEEMSLETLHQSEIYAGDRTYNEEYFRRIKELLNLEFVDYRDLLKLMDQIPDDEAKTIAEKLKSNAYWIRDGIKDEHLVTAAKIYLAMKKLIKEKNADAITINCFTILLRDLNALPVTPCIPLSLLNDEGIPAACEADLNSMIMQIVFKHLAGKPSWIVDPVIDFKDNVVIHAHCTAPTKMKGYNKEPEPYAIDSHDESGKPATIRTKMSIGQEFTAAQISADFKRLVVHKGIIEDTPIVELACRTKVQTRVKSAKEYLWNYVPPLHRVLVYGDLTRDLEYFAKLLGLEYYMEA